MRHPLPDRYAVEFDGAGSSNTCNSLHRPIEFSSNTKNVQLASMGPAMRNVCSSSVAITAATSVSPCATVRVRGHN